MKTTLYLVTWRTLDRIDREHETLRYAISPDRAGDMVVYTEWYMKRDRILIVRVEPV
jgi:hypothetical protein